jgi:UDP-N-acetylglucosamine 2-epimerase (non-hydrolysing)
MKIISVVGARPNFMKIAPFINAIHEVNTASISPLGEKRQQGKAFAVGDDKGGHIKHILVHTGQHYDDRMSKAFFESLGIPETDINLGIGSGSHAEQVGHTMIAFEKVLLAENPDWVVVVGDVNATLACSVTAKKLNIKVCHIEAGLRSGDMSMPEEINRLVTDRLSDLLLTPDMLSGENLRKEGVPEEKVKFVGNIMIDTLEANRNKATQMAFTQIIEQNRIAEQKSVTFNPQLLEQKPYAVMTLHRPSNVDNREIFTALIRFLLDEVTKTHILIWPIHPRTRKRLEEFSLWEEVVSKEGILLLEPIGYHEMLKLNMGASVMLTDSGGLQEECCVLGTPCLTLRWNTERPVTLREHGGVSILVGNNIERIREEYRNTLNQTRNPQRPELWDGNTAMRCVEAIVHYPQT